jgi:hypothetical protein
MNSDEDYDLHTQYILGCEAVVDLDSSTGACSDDVHSVSVTSLSSGVNCSPAQICINDVLNDVTV